MGKSITTKQSLKSFMEWAEKHDWIWIKTYEYEHEDDGSFQQWLAPNGVEITVTYLKDSIEHITTWRGKYDN